MLTSIPTPQPQPSDAFYDISKLNLFTDFSRVTYLAAAGEDAPTGDNTKRPKSWLDTSLSSKAPTDQVTYKVIDATGALSSITMTVAEASAVNIAGYHSFPAYVVAPTGATAGGAGLNPGYLSTRDQANQLAAALSLDASAVTENVLAGPLQIVYPPSEIRREYQINFKGVPCNVGVFLAEQNANGVGSPGAWDLTGPEPNWISSQPSPQTFVLPPWPDPIRNLLPNEKLVQQGIFGGGRPLVVRTDMESPYNHLAPSTPASPASGGGLTDAQAGQLAAIATGVQSLVGVFKASGAL